MLIPTEGCELEPIRMLQRHGCTVTEMGTPIRQIKLGTYPAMELAEARAEFLSQKKLREQNKDPRQVAAEAKGDAERREFTLAVMVEQYLSGRVELDRKERGAAETRRLLGNDLGRLSGRRVEEVAPAEIHDHVRVIAQRTPVVALSFRAELARAWRYAANTGCTSMACPTNSDTGGRLRQGKRERHLSKDELQLLLPWMKSYSATVQDALMLTLCLGLRSGEVCKLRDDWLGEEGDGYWITIPASEMKRDHSDHRVPLEGAALGIVQRRSGGGFWFPSKEAPYIKQKVLGVEVYSHSGRSKNKVICPVGDWAPNDLRKTARTLLVVLGCPFEVTESILHHRLPGVGGLYSQHQYDAEKHEWLAKLGEIFTGFGGAV